MAGVLTDRRTGTSSAGPTTDRATGRAGSVAVKAPCKACATSNITLSGEQTIDGQSCVDGDRVLVTAQTSSVNNGIYLVSTGNWSRAPDFDDSHDAVKGSLVRVHSGTSNSGIYELTTADTVDIGTDAITFSNVTSVIAGGLLAANNLSDVADAFTALRNLMENGSDIVCANPLVLTSAGGDFVNVTGNTNFSAVTLAEGKSQWVRFTGTPLITVGASLVGNNGGSDVQIAAGDIVLFRGYASSVVRFIRFPIAGALTFATTTEVLTGTETAKVVSPDALAALWEAGSDNTGGATITMGEGGYFNLITSTTSITAFAFTTDKAGRTAIVRFDTARTLTHNATSLILPGAANITTAQGDRAQVRSLGSGNFIVDWYTKADGTPVVGSAASAATQAEQETGSSTTVYVSPGRQQFHASACKFWALVAGAGTSITASYNVTSVTDTGTGNLTVTIATDFSSADWMVFGWSTDSFHDSTDDHTSIETGSKAAGTIQLLCGTDLDGSAADPTDGYRVGGFGDHA